MKNTLLFTSISLIASIASADAFLYESFDNGALSPNADGVALGNNDTSDGNGSWVLSNDGTGSATNSYENNGNYDFVAGDNPFGIGGTSFMQQTSSGLQSALEFTPLAAGETLYFSFNIQSVDSPGATAGDQVVDFFSQGVNASLFRLSFENNGDGTYGMSMLSGTGSSSLAIDRRNAHFVYGSLSTSADLKTWTFNASIVDDIANISTSDSDYDFTRTQVFATARSETASIMTFDGGTNRFVYDEIRLGTVYSDVTNVVPEPSAYSLISGALALGWIMVRRRK